MTQSDLQWEFLQCLAQLIEFAKSNGYKLTAGDLYRDPIVHGEFGKKKGYGAARSVHKLRMAIDLNLFVGGEYRTDTDAHRELGEYWESLHDKARWGGHFSDGNHYSFEYWGVK